MPFEDILDDILKTDKDKERTEDITQYVAFVIDESGSMGIRKTQAIEDFNKQIDTLYSESGEDITTRVIMTKFNEVVKPGDVVSLDEITKLSDDNYNPGGYTALYDAIGETAVRLMQRYRKDDSDAAVLMVVITDGQENASKEYNADNIKSLIKKLEGTGRWTFSYMGIGSQKEMFTRAASIMGFSGGNVAIAKDTISGRAMNFTGTQTLYQARRAGETQTASFYNQTDDSTDDKEDS